MLVRFAPLLLPLAGVLWTTSARADDLETVLEQPVVTTVSQTAESDATAPATTSVITAEDLRRHGIRTLNEAINYLGLGMFTTNPTHGGEIGARGVQVTGDYGNHMLLLIDGHAVNEPYAGAAYFDRGLGVPIELIDHIELVLGPGAVLYGSNAMLGVVHVITKRASDYRGVHVIADSELFTWGKLGVGAGTTVDVLGRRIEITTQVEDAEQRGPWFTFAPQNYGNDSVTGAPKRFTLNGPGTGVWGGGTSHANTSRAPAAYLRLVAGDLDISLRASSYQRSSAYPDGIIGYVGAFNAPNNYELERWLFADVKYRVLLSRKLELKTRLYADHYTYDWRNSDPAAEDCEDGQIDGCRRHLGATSRWIGAEARATYDWTTSGTFATMLGTDARYERVDAGSHIVGLGAGAPIDEGKVDVGNLRLGVYAQQTAMPFSWVAFNAGARVDVAEGYPGALSPRASVAVMPWSGATWKALYSSAFRAPSSYEREYEDPTFIRNPNLGPEHEHSVEGSIAQRFGANRVMFGVFRTEWTDLVVATTLSEAEIAALGGTHGPDVSQFRNASRIDNYGYNASADGVALGRRLRWGLNVTGAYSRAGPSGADSLPVTVAPSFFGNARASYDLGDRLPTFALAAQFAGKRYADRAFDSGFTSIPRAPPVLELRAAVTGDLPWVRGLSYRVTANYAFESTGPYVIGPIQSGSLGAPTLNPVDRFRVGVGLHWVWDGP